MDSIKPKRIAARAALLAQRTVAASSGEAPLGFLTHDKFVPHRVQEGHQLVERSVKGLGGLRVLVPAPAQVKFLDTVEVIEGS